MLQLTYVKEYNTLYLECQPCPKNKIGAEMKNYFKIFILHRGTKFINILESLCF